jgi:hypothetical protein
MASQGVAFAIPTIFPSKSVCNALDHLPGAKSGRQIGPRSGIAPTPVANWRPEPPSQAHNSMSLPADPKSLYRGGRRSIKFTRQFSAKPQVVKPMKA